MPFVDPYSHDVDIMTALERKSDDALKTPSEWIERWAELPPPPQPPTVLVIGRSPCLRRWITADRPPILVRGASIDHA